MIEKEILLSLEEVERMNRTHEALSTKYSTLRRQMRDLEQEAIQSKSVEWLSSMFNEGNSFLKIVPTERFLNLLNHLRETNSSEIQVEGKTK